MTHVDVYTFWCIVKTLLATRWHDIVDVQEKSSKIGPIWEVYGHEDDTLKFLVQPKPKGAFPVKPRAPVMVLESRCSV